MELPKTAAKTLLAAACGSAATFACQWAYGKYFNGPENSDKKFPQSTHKRKAKVIIVDKSQGSSSQSSSSQSNSSQSSSCQSSSSQSPSSQSFSCHSSSSQGSSIQDSSGQGPSCQGPSGQCSSGQEFKGTGKDKNKSVKPKTNEKCRKHSGYKPLAREIGNSHASKVGLVSPLSANGDKPSETKTLKKETKTLKKEDSGIVDDSGSQAMARAVQSSNMNLCTSSGSLRLSEECVCAAPTAEDIFQDSSLENLHQDKEGTAKKSHYVGTIATTEVGIGATPEFADKCIDTEESGYCKGDEDIILIDRRLLHMIIQSVMQLETRLQQYEGGSGETVSFLQQLMQQ